jgi:hypothetical protein
VRKPFRTTIDDELLSWVKKEAIDRGINANDILEEMISAKIDEKNYAKNVDGYLEKSPEYREEYLRRRLACVIEDFFAVYDIYFKDPILYDEITRFVTRIVLTKSSPFHQKFFPEKE